MSILSVVDGEDGHGAYVGGIAELAGQSAVQPAVGVGNRRNDCQGGEAQNTLRACNFADQNAQKRTNDKLHRCKYHAFQQWLTGLLYVDLGTVAEQKYRKNGHGTGLPQVGRKAADLKELGYKGIDQHTQ